MHALLFPSSGPRAGAKRAPAPWQHLLACLLLLLGLGAPHGRALAQLTAQPSPEPALPSGSGLEFHKLVLCTDGTIKGWGLNYGGQLGNQPSSVPTPVTIAFPGPAVVRVAVGTSCSFAVCADGSLWAWGSGSDGELGLGSTTLATSTPTQVSGISNVVDVSAGMNHTMALCADGSVWTWGRRSTGALGTGPTGPAVVYTPQPVPPSSPAGIRAIASGYLSCLALDANGHVWSWGTNSYGELGLAGVPQNAIQFTPAQIQLNNVRQIDAIAARGIALLADGTVWNWGHNNNYQLGLGHTNYVDTPTQVGPGSITGATWVALNTSSAIAVNPDGSTYVWGGNEYGSLGRTTPTVAQLPVAGPVLSAGAQVAGINNQFTSLERTGLVKTWGSEPLGYTPAPPSPPYPGSYTPTTPTGLCPAVPMAAFPACGPQRAYYQNAAATYVAAAHGYTVSPAEIGRAGAVTLIDVSQAPYNGTLVFDGVYHLLGTVRFRGGQVRLRPGTVFYVDGRSGPGAAEFSTELQVEQGSLQLTTARLLASCDDMWGGIHLMGNARIYTSGQSFAGGTKFRYTEIQDALYGILSDPAPGAAYDQRNTNEYYLDRTYFINNVIGLYDNFKGTALAGEGVTNCAFFTDAATAKPGLGAATGAGTGIVLDPRDPTTGFGGDYSAASFTSNLFSHLTTGIWGVGKDLTISGSAFSNCWYAALTTGGFNSSRAPMQLLNTTFSIPAALPNGGTAAYGILGNLSLTGCTFQGATANPTTNAVRQVGLSGFQMDNSVLQDNTFQGLDCAVEQELSGNWGPGLANRYIHNLFSSNAEGLRFFSHPASLPPANEDLTIRCNTFENPLGLSGALGIHITSGTKFPLALGGDGSPGQLPPNGNRFAGVANANNSTSFTYFGYPLSHESPGFGPIVNYVPVNTNTVGACGGGNGVNRQIPTPDRLMSSVELRVNQDSLATAALAPNRREAMLQLVLGYYRQRDEWAALEAYVAQLPIQNTLMYAPLAIGLMTHYEEQGQEAEVQRLAGTLLRRGAMEPGLRSYALLADLLSRKRGYLTHPGIALLAGDVSVLREVAASGTDAARRACQILRYYEPACICQLPNQSSSPQMAAASRNVMSRGHLMGGIYPNPARDMIRISYAIPAGTIASLEVHNALGQRVAVLALAPTQQETRLAVAALPAGVYVCRLLLNGQVQAVQRLAVVH